MAENIREIVLDTLLTLEKGEEYSHRLIHAVLDKHDYLEGRDKAFIKRLAEGTIERQTELDHHLNRFSRLPVRKMKPLIRCLLRMSAYQLLYMDTVPDSAVCNEAVKLAGKRGFQNLKGFVNGVLRNLSRQKESLSLPAKEKEPVDFLSVKYSMPDWLVELWLSAYGREVTEKLLGGLLRIHPVSLRFSSLLSPREREDEVERLCRAGVKLTASPYLPCVYLAEHTENISMLPGFAEGIFTVQDVSSALAVEAAQIRNTDFVMDICAAPGGKSLLAAEKAQRVLARDVSAKKTDVIEENIHRAGAENIQVQIFDATEFDAEYEGKADVVLMDVPCSGLGVMGKKRDIKYRVTPEEIQSLTGLQRRIVDNSWRYVKPGGILLYSTCTIHSAENEAMVEYISRSLPFDPVSLEEALPPVLWEQKRNLEARLRGELWPGLGAKANAGTEAGQEAEANAGTEPGQEAKANAGTEAGQEAETNAGTEPGQEAKANAGTEPGQEAEANAGTEPGQEAKANPEPVTRQGAEAQQEERMRQEEARRAEWGRRGLPELTEKERASCIQLLPGYMECDGFFFAKFRRRE